MAENLQHRLLALLLGTGDEPGEIVALKRALAESIRRTTETPQGPILTVEQQRQTLRETFERLNVRHAFVPGQIVRWKPGLRHRLLPAPEQLAIVLEVLQQPIYDQIPDSNQINFREPLDIRLGVLGPFGDLVPYWFDSRRFEPAG